MKTRLFETNAFIRASVKSIAVARTFSTGVGVDTRAVRAAAGQMISSADSAMLEQQDRAKVGVEAAGRLRVEAVTPHIIRVRYAQGGTVPRGQTPMLVGLPDAPTTTITEQDDVIELATDALRTVIHRDPYRLELFDRKTGERVTGVGGLEKNNFCTWAAVNTSISRTADGAPIAMECFDLAGGACVYGLGEQFIGLDKVGQTIDLDMTDALGVTTARAYKNIPFYVTTHGYGVFFNHACRITCWVGSSSRADVQVALEDDFLDYFIITGSIAEVLDRYTDLTGKGVVPPRWTFGYWQSKISYRSAEETLGVARGMREHDIPCDVIHLDTNWFDRDWLCDLEFGKERFPDPQGFLAELAAMGFKVSLWQLPYIPEGSKLFDDLAAVDGFVKNAEGGIYDIGICFTHGFEGVVGVIDYTNPAAVKVHQDALARLFRMGAHVIKTDFGEAAPANGVYHDGTPGHRMHNLYPLLYNAAVSQVTERETGSGVMWARSAWAGGQRYPIHWGGDSSPNFANMRPQIEGGLSLGLSGFQFWSQDIGGFCGTTNERLLIRWMQLGMFASHSRVHGAGDREVYKFDETCRRVCRDYIRLRYRLLPYILGQAKDCVARSLPMLRPLVVDDQRDPNVWRLSDQFLFGSHLLVAPILDEGTRRRVYLPEGTWTDWWTMEPVAGGRWIDVDADLETIPLFIREGGVVPLGPVMSHVDAQPTEAVELRIGPWRRDGRTSIRLPLAENKPPVTVTYSRSGNEHAIEHDGDGLTVTASLGGGVVCPSGKTTTITESDMTTSGA